MFTPKERKERPVVRGVLDYFPDALLEVAHVSWVGNEQHNPGEPLHWAKEKSTDEADALVRHLMERGKVDSDGIRHSAKVAWRALALLQRELEEVREGRRSQTPLGSDKWTPRPLPRTMSPNQSEPPKQFDPFCLEQMIPMTPGQLGIEKSKTDSATSDPDQGWIPDLW